MKLRLNQNSNCVITNTCAETGRGCRVMRELVDCKSLKVKMHWFCCLRFFFIFAVEIALY